MGWRLVVVACAAGLLASAAGAAQNIQADPIVRASAPSVSVTKPLAAPDARPSVVSPRSSGPVDALIPTDRRPRPTPSAAATTHVPPVPAGASVWLPYWDMANALTSTEQAAGVLSVASPFWYEARSPSSIVGRPTAGDPGVIARLRAAGLAVVPTIAAPIQPATLVGWSNADRRTHARAIADLARANGFDGIDLDYEHPALTVSTSEAIAVRAAFTALVEAICDELHLVGKWCIVTVMPRESDDPTVWRSKLIPWIYDYRALGAAADRVRVMAYDQHAPNTAPGPIGGLPWTEAVARYTASTVPLSKVELGLPLYGRDWRSDGVVRTVLGDDWQRLLDAGHRPTWDDHQGAPVLRYASGGVAHEVWFSDSVTVALRRRLASSMGFAGVAFWAAGQEGPGALLQPDIPLPVGHGRQANVSADTPAR